jgi:hypothetical protein
MELHATSFNWLFQEIILKGNKMENFVGGCIVGAFILGLFLTLVPSSYHAQAKAAITECERTLPRNQECMVIAVPKSVFVPENK